MRHLEDKRCCPRCGAQLHEHPYLMSRRAPANLISWRTMAWIAAAVVFLVVVSLAT